MRSSIADDRYAVRPSIAVRLRTMPVTTAPPAPPGVAGGPAATSTAPDGGAPVPGSGRTWGPAVEISDPAIRDLQSSPQVGLDDAGNAVAVWRELLADHTRNAVWASRYAAGAAWSPPITIDNAVGNASDPHLAMTPSGTALVAFGQSETNQGGAQLVTVRRTPRIRSSRPIAAGIAARRSSQLGATVFAQTSGSSSSMRAIGQPA